MKLLAFDTSTELMSIAVTRNDRGAAQTWSHRGAGGAQASLMLIDEVMKLLERAGLRLQELDALCFGSGPGSFTGLRTACAVAQGLACGAGLLVLPVGSLWAVAEDARFAHAAGAAALQVTALLDARMDEVYAASLAYTDGVWREVVGASVSRPEALVLPDPHAWPALGLQAMAGNVFDRYGERLPPKLSNAPRWNATPTAEAVLRLAPAMLRAGGAMAPHLALPTYVRDKVAQTSAERTAFKLQQVAVRA